MKSKFFKSISNIIVLSMILNLTPTMAKSVSQFNPASEVNLASAVIPLEYPDKVAEELRADLMLNDQFPAHGLPGLDQERYRLGEEEEVEREYVPPTPEDLARTADQVRAFDCSTVTDVPQSECEALVALYASTNGAGWTTNTNWLVTTTVDNWSGVWVYFGHIYFLKWIGPDNSTPWGNNLVGAIPPELGNLTELRSLYLPNNELSGVIPPELGNLTNLENFDLGDNNLSGEIPSGLGNLSHLYYLRLTGQYLGNIFLSGPIPPELGKLSRLSVLDLSRNLLSGSIPSELGDIPYLESLNLSNNRLSGGIPSSIGKLNYLKKLNLSNNLLVGEIPSLLGNLSYLESLKIYGNNLTGTIPSWLGNLINLKSLDLDHNQFTGELPIELSHLNNMLSLYLNGNQLSGPVPAWLGDLSMLELIYLDDNQFTGAIPPVLGNLSKLRRLNLSSNQLTGSIPLSFINLPLFEFNFSNTSLCEPTSPEFLAWKASVSAWQGTGLVCVNEPEIIISHVEWTQSVQDYENSVPLIAEKDTLVRVFVRSNNIPIRSLSGTIVAKRDGVVLDGSPMSWIVKNTYSGSLNFVLPKSWTSEGALELTISVDNSSSLVTSLLFHSSPEIKIVYIPIEYNGSTADPTKMANAISWMRDAYPNSNIIYKPGLFSTRWDPDPSCNKFFVNDEVVFCRALDLLKNLSRLYDLYYDQNYDFIVGWLPNEAKSLFTLPLGLSWLNGISSPLWINMDGKSVWYGEWSKMDTGVAHELGHNLDQRHSNSANCQPSYIDHNSDWPWPDSSYIHDIGWRAGTKTFYAPFQYFDIMSYCDPQWISKHTYTEIFDYWSEFKASQIRTQLTEDPLLVISGLIFSDDEATMDPIWEKQVTSPWSNPPVGTDYCIESLDSLDAVINNQCFDLDFFDHETQQSISTDSYVIKLPAAPNLSKIELKKGDLVLASRVLSSNAPQVELTSPNGGEIWGPTGLETISWIGNDSDGDSLFYNVYYSLDNGFSWEPLAIDLETASLEVETGSIPGSSVAKIRVSVTDGLHSDFDDSDLTFTVLPKVPQVSISLQEGISDFLASRFVTLKGIGYDLEDGELSGANLCWSSDLDGALGCGESLNVNLTTGSHVITLEAVDSDSNVAKASISISAIDCFTVNTYTDPIYAGGVTVDIAPNCSVDPDLYATGTSVQLNIEPDLGFDFLGWIGDASGIELPLNLVVSSDLLIGADFEQTTFYVYLPLIMR